MPLVYESAPLSPDLLAKLREPFPAADISQGQPKADGFRPQYISWDKICKRLDDVFGGNWSQEVHRFELIQNQWIVHVSLRVTVYDKEHDRLDAIVRDGIGTWPLSMCGSSCKDIGDDLKSAESEALKRAAVKFGIGVQLYTREGNMVAPHATQAAPVQAQAFQIAAVKKFMAAYGLPDEWWCKSLEVASLDQMPALLAANILSGQHPIVAWLKTTYPTITAAPAAGVLKTGNA